MSIILLCTVHSAFGLSLLLRQTTSLGVHAWVPHGKCKPMNEVVIDDVLHCINLGSELQPPRLADLQQIRSQLPLEFHQRPPRGAHVSDAKTFPNAPGPAFPLLVARRTLTTEEFESVEFLLGGSELDALASQLSGYRSTDDRAGVRLVATMTDGVIVLATIRPYYSSDGPALGAQFENLVTGRALEAPRSNVRFEHVSMAEISGNGSDGSFRVLLSGECDSVDDAGRPVEIKSGNPKYFGQRTAMQMLATGCESLVYAERTRNTLQQVHRASVDDVLMARGPLMSGSAVFGDVELANIQAGLQLLRRHFAAGGSEAEIVHRDGKLILLP